MRMQTFVESTRISRPADPFATYNYAEPLKQPTLRRRRLAVL
jgi:hypothetical protein